MKKYLSTLVAVMLAALSFTLTSCSDDDEKDEPTINAGLVGRWVCTDANIEVAIPGATTDGGMTVGDYMQFNEDGTMEYSEDGSVIKGKYKFENNKITGYDLSDPETLPGTFDVLKLTDKELVLYMNLYIAQATYTFAR